MKIILVFGLAIFLTGCGCPDKRICSISTADDRKDFILKCTETIYLQGCIDTAERLYCPVVKKKSQTKNGWYE